MSDGRLAQPEPFMNEGCEVFDGPRGHAKIWPIIDVGEYGKFRSKSLSRRQAQVILHSVWDRLKRGMGR